MIEMSTTEAMTLFASTITRRFYQTCETKRDGAPTQKTEDIALRVIRFPAGVLKTLTACNKPMKRVYALYFHALFPRRNCPTPARRQSLQLSPSSIGITDPTPITYAEAVAIVKQARNGKSRAKTGKHYPKPKDVRDCIMSLESLTAVEADMELDPERFLVAAQAALLRWRLIDGYDWAFVRRVLVRLFRMARNEWSR
jgi:hypothetical protein